MVAKNDRIVTGALGATTEVATLKQALTEAENKAATERTEREKHEAWVDSKTRESEHAAALESTKSAKAEAQKALRGIEAMKKIAAGKAFIMQSKHVKVNYLLLT